MLFTSKVNKYMNYLVTLSDEKYIDKGLVLFDSLISSTDVPFKLYYLCLDYKTFNIINQVNDRRLIPYQINNIIDEDDFKKLSESSKIIDDKIADKPVGFSTYHFASASYILYHLMKKYDIPEIIYIDSDIKFYGDFNTLFDIVKNKSIGIVLHRHNEFGCEVGVYNVGIIYFRNDEPGIKCLKWWRDCLIDKDNPWAKEYGGCGDQKYLEAFGKLFGDENIKIFDDDIGHGAPWNFRLYKYLGNNNIIWGDKQQKILFNHFSHFEQNYENNTYNIDRENEWGNCLSPYFKGVIKEYYDDYFEHLKKIKGRYNL